MAVNRFIDKNIDDITASIGRALSDESRARREGFLQSLNPLVKLITFSSILIVTLISRSTLVILAVYLGCLAFASFSRINPDFFLRRTWIFIPFFTAMIAVPAVFLTPGDAVWSIFGVTATEQGISAAALLVLRTATAVSISTLVVLTTRWDDLLAALKIAGIPSFVVSALYLSYRYIFVFINLMRSFLLGFKSRLFSSLTWRRNLWFSGRTIGILFVRSLRLADELYLAMVSRGMGIAVKPRSFGMSKNDFLWIVFTLVSGTIILWKG